MNITNIALIRATNIIPFDGIVKSISNSPYIKKNKDTEFAKKMLSLLKEKQLIPPLDYSNFSEEYLNEYSKLIEQTLDEYIPYTSDYNSMVLFSLNGLVPDDSEMGFGNNTFSNKKCAIIEPLEKHIDSVISLTPTDTVIKGDVHLSNEAIILIEEETFQSLTESQKKRLEKLPLSIRLFQGSLRDAIANELKNSNRYTAETLSLSRKNGGYLESETSEELKLVINQIAKINHIPQILFFNLLTGQHNNQEQLQEVERELMNFNLVNDYYLSMFYKSLFSILNVSDELKGISSEYMKYDFFLNQIIEAIKQYGIEKYKSFIKAYNLELEKQRDNNTLITPNEIILQTIPNPQYH